MPIIRWASDKASFDGVAFLTIFLVALGFADAPFLLSGLPLGDDTELHLYRLVDLDHLIRQGIFYPRWQPDQVYGFGSPLFSFYAPLSAYLVESVHLLGVTFRGGLLLVFAAMPVIAGIATYAFLRRRLASGPALLGAIAYVSSLYFLANIFLRGSISDGLAMALYPVVLLTLDRLCAQPGPGRASALGFAIAALLLSHNVSGPILIPLVILLAGWWSGRCRRSMVWSIVGVGLGLGLAIFFLGPAALGAADTRVPEWLAEPGSQFSEHFVPPGDLFVVAATATPGSMLANVPLGIGLVQILVALAAIPALPRLRWRERGEVIIFCTFMLTCAFLTVPASQAVWSAVSPLKIVSLPWRLLVIPDLTAALLASYAAEAWLPRRGRLAGPAFGLVAVVLLILAVPYLEPLPGSSLLASPTLADVTAFQQRSGALGTTSNSEFLPAGLTKFPAGPPFPGADQGALLDQKLDQGGLPAAVVAQTVTSSQLTAILAFDSPAPFIAHFFVFRFPGWSATIDGRPSTWSDPGQFHTLTVEIPTGKHELAVSFGETHRQLAFDLVSAMSVVVLLGLAGFPLVRKPLAALSTVESAATEAAKTGIAHGHEFSELSRRSGAAVVGVLIAVVVAIGLRWAVVDRVNTPLVRSFDGQRPPDMEVSSLHRFGDAIDLLGYTSPSTIGRDTSLKIDLYWRTTAQLTVNYRPFVRIVAANGKTVAEAGKPHVADFPTKRWRIGSYARDMYAFTVPPTLPPGIYRIAVGLSDPVTGRRLPIDGKASGSDILDLAPLNVEQ